MSTRFPELTDEQNQTIDNARNLGFAAYYPCYPSAQAQADNTLIAAKEFLRRFHQGREAACREDGK